MNKSSYSTSDAAAGNSAESIVDKLGYARRWNFSKRTIDNFIAMGMPILKIGTRRVRILVPEADEWMKERFGHQRKGATPTKL